MFGNPWFYVALLAIFFIGVTKSGFGSGVGLIIVPLLALAMDHGGLPGHPASAALGLLLPLLVVGDFISIYQHRGYFLHRPSSETNSLTATSAHYGPVAVAVQAPPTHSTRQILRLILPGTFAGILVGSFILWSFHQHQQLVASLMKIEIGVESILLVGLQWWRNFRGVQTRLMPEPARGIVTGLFAGASSTLAHAAGPIIAMYLLPLKLERKLFVATCALYFFILNAAKLPFYYQAGLFHNADLSFTVRFLPVVILGALTGFWVNGRINDKLFSQVLYACTFLLGWYVMGDGIRTLWR